MNEFAAKKLGEVLAFAIVGQETAERGAAAIKTGFGDELADRMKFVNESHAETIRTIAAENGVTEIVEKKLESTGAKLRSMRDLYVGDQWDNPTELLEWSGFFEGAAVVHWALVQGAGETLAAADPSKAHTDLVTLATAGKAFHDELFKTATEELHRTGNRKVQ